jgi:RimJ/RimL family protein N-acetyltransferase
VEEARRDLETYARIWKEHGVGYWAVELEGTFVGVAGIRPVELAGRAVWNVFYRFFPTVWGRGYALEAVREAVAVAESVAVERPIVALTLPANTASIRVAERAGLVRRPELDRDGHVAFARGW